MQLPAIPGFRDLVAAIAGKLNEARASVDDAAVAMDRNLTSPVARALTSVAAKMTDMYAQMLGLATQITSLDDQIRNLIPDYQWVEDRAHAYYQTAISWAEARVQTAYNDLYGRVEQAKTWATDQANAALTAANANLATAKKSLLLKAPITGTQWSQGDAFDGPYNGQDKRKAMVSPYKVSYTNTWHNDLTGEDLPPAAYVSTTRDWDTEADWINKQIIHNRGQLTAEYVARVNARVGEVWEDYYKKKQADASHFASIDAALANFISKVDFNAFKNDEGNFRLDVKNTLLPQTQAAIEKKYAEADAAVQAEAQRIADRLSTDRANAALEAANSNLANVRNNLDDKILQNNVSLGDLDARVRLLETQIEKVAPVLSRLPKL